MKLFILFNDIVSSSVLLMYISIYIHIYIFFHFLDYKHKFIELEFFVKDFSYLIASVLKHKNIYIFLNFHYYHF